MKKKFTLNFWYALLLLIGVRLLAGVIFALAALLFTDLYDNSDIFKISLHYLESLLFIPPTIFFLKKTNINIKESFFIPALSTVISVITIVVLYQTIVITPLWRTNEFIESLLNHQLKIFGGSIKSFFFPFYFNVVIMGPIIEELFFRGLILKNFLRKYSPVWAILLSSLLFGAHHLSIANLHYYIIAGMLFGFIYYKTNSLIIVTLAHILVNIIAQFNFEYIELDMSNSILHLSIYTIALLSVVLLLKKGLKPIPINDRSPYSDK